MAMSHSPWTLEIYVPLVYHKNVMSFSRFPRSIIQFSLCQALKETNSSTFAAALGSPKMEADEQETLESSKVSENVETEDHVTQ